MDLNSPHIWFHSRESKVRAEPVTALARQLLRPNLQIK